MKNFFIFLFILSFALSGMTQDVIEPGTVPDNLLKSTLIVEADEGLSSIYSVTGKYYLSADGIGSLFPSMAVNVHKPTSSATVHKAFLFSASYNNIAIGDGCVTILSIPVNWDGSAVGSAGPSYPNYFHNYWSDVTTIVASHVDAQPAGNISIPITECSGNIDGEALLVIFNDESAQENTVAILWGAIATTGDNFSITLSDPIDPTDPESILDMGLGISFGYQGIEQYSKIDVNGDRLTTSAGGQDDGIHDNNGALMTVGGIGDLNTNPANPLALPNGNQRYDDELYSLLPFIDNTTTMIDVLTHNPSNDDNIFLSYFVISGEAWVTTDCPEDIVVGNDPGVCGAVVNYATPEGTQTEGLASGEEFPVGTTTNTFVDPDCSFTVTVNNTILPEISLVTGPADPVELGIPADIAVSHNDDDNLDFLKIDWGDGTFENIPNPSLSPVNIDHTYTEPGVYSVAVLLVDLCGEQDLYEYQYIVIYDPDGGFVTGGGWFWSEACAFKATEGVEGKANFGFVAKYKKGSTVPIGKTEFQFQAGDINFHSSVYDDMRLVIANHKANYKGTGTINGEGNFGFMVSVVDGDILGDGIDKFRIKIWDKASDVVVYDNNCLETDENAEPATAIDGGSIVIHSGKKEKSAEINSFVSTEIESNTLVVYPNPFNEKVYFEFSREEASNAIIELFDVTGRKLQILFDQSIEAEQLYRVEYNPQNLSGNMLFYRITFDLEVINGKLTNR